MCYFCFGYYSVCIYKPVYYCVIINEDIYTGCKLFKFLQYSLVSYLSPAQHHLISEPVYFSLLSYLSRIPMCICMIWMSRKAFFDIAGIK